MQTEPAGASFFVILALYFAMTAEGIFSDIHDPELIQEIQSASVTKTFEAETIMLEPGDYIRSVPIVLSGSLKVMRQDEQGNEILLYYIRPGESCIMSFLGGLNQTRSKVKVVVEEQAEIMMIPLNVAHHFIEKFPAWNSFIFQLYNKRFEELLQTINAIAFKKIDQRLVDFLQTKKRNTGLTELVITHQQIADELGTAREVVSRLLKQLEHEGRIALGRNKIRLLNLD